MKPVGNKIFTNRIKKAIEIGLLPSHITNLSDIQQRFYNELKTTKDMDIVVFSYLNYANDYGKKLYLYKKIMQKESSMNLINKGTSFNISSDDIILNEYCPFFNTKLNYNSQRKNCLSDPTYASIDRIDNSKGYVKGNVWIISRLANQMKNNASIDELKTFCKNAILIHAKKI
jgi:hypothetical protein